MSEKIEYIVNEKGEKIKAVIPIDLLNKLLSGKIPEESKMNRRVLKQYADSIKLTVDPMDFQREIRNEWQ